MASIKDRGWYEAMACPPDDGRTILVLDSGRTGPDELPFDRRNDALINDSITDSSPSQTKTIMIAKNNCLPDR